MNEEREELFNKLLNLEKRLNKVKADKKNAASDYKDQIKDIETEIKEIVEELGDE